MRKYAVVIILFFFSLPLVFGQTCKSEGEGCASNNECCPGLACVKWGVAKICMQKDGFSCCNSAGTKCGESEDHKYLKYYKYLIADICPNYCCEGSDDCDDLTACCKTSRCQSLLPTTCSESDGGKDYATKGNCIDTAGSHSDVCVDVYTLEEYYCSGGSCASTQIDCRNYCNNGNAVCSSGKCNCPITDKPDLVIEKVWADGTLVHYTVKNSGNTSAGFSFTYLYAENQVYVSRVSSLGSGKSYSGEFSGYKCVGSKSIKVCADGSGDVDESNEYNNCMSKTLRCCVKEGGSCSKTTDCCSSLECKSGKCTKPSCTALGGQCMASSECPSTSNCRYDTDCPTTYPCCCVPQVTCSDLGGKCMTAWECVSSGGTCKETSDCSGSSPCCCVSQVTCKKEGESCSLFECCPGLACVKWGVAKICMQKDGFSCCNSAGTKCGESEDHKYLKYYKYPLPLPCSNYCCEGSDDCDDLTACCKRSKCKSIKMCEFEGVTKCENNVEYVCRNGRWIRTKECLHGCNANGKVCNKCCYNWILRSCNCNRASCLSFLEVEKGECIPCSDLDVLDYTKPGICMDMSGEYQDRCSSFEYLTEFKCDEEGMRCIPEPIDCSVLCENGHCEDGRCVCPHIKGISSVAYAGMTMSFDIINTESSLTLVIPKQGNPLAYPVITTSKRVTLSFKEQGRVKVIVISFKPLKVEKHWVTVLS